MASHCAGTRHGRRSMLNLRKQWEASWPKFLLPDAHILCSIDSNLADSISFVFWGATLISGILPLMSSCSMTRRDRGNCHRAHPCEGKRAQSHRGMATEAQPHTVLGIRSILSHSLYMSRHEDWSKRQAKSINRTLSSRTI